MKHIIRRPALVIVAVLASCASAYAQERYSVDVTFNDGGRAVGYFVVGEPFSSGWDSAIRVSGGDEGQFPPIVYDGAFDGGSVAGMASYTITHGIGLARRRLRVSRPGFLGSWTIREESVSGSADRSVTGVTLTPETTMFLALTVNDLHPASRLVASSPAVKLAVDAISAAEPRPLDWYWAILLNGSLFFITPGGASLTPAPLLVGIQQLGHLTLFEMDLPPGTELTNFFFALDGTEVVAFDSIKVVVTNPLDTAPLAGSRGVLGLLQE